ncbi:MAG: hypothetical protein PHY47_15975 [Lachnospiraceae bacterium]|nr:hypothetical protein [Lachnospiraceae bacterium]
MEQLNRLYERFLDCNYTPGLFWTLSINEAIDMIESYNRRKETSQKEDYQKLASVLDLFGANLIEKVMITLGATEGATFSLLEYLPDLFPNVHRKANTNDNNVPEKQEDKPQLSPDMQLYKAQRIQHAYRTNKARNRSNDQ